MFQLIPRVSVLAASLILVGALSAQMQRFAGIPMVSPPVKQPAFAGQPLIGNDRPTRPSGGGSAQRVKRDASTQGVKLEGRKLKKAVAKVKKLPWNKSLRKAKTKSSQSGKPILLLQTLGDIGGYA